MRLFLAVETLGAIAALVTLSSLWFRRTAVGCRHEGPATAMVICAALAAFLTSGIASAAISPWFYQIFGLWNLEDLIGHFCGLATVSMLVYMIQMRCGNQEDLRHGFSTRVLAPLMLITPALCGLFVNSAATDVYRAHLDEVITNQGALQLYCFLFEITLTYLLLYAARGLLILRRRDGATLTIDMYIMTVGMTLVFCTLLILHATLGINVHDPAWFVGYFATIGWTCTPAISWYHRTAALREARRQLRRNGSRLRLSE